MTCQLLTGIKSHKQKVQSLYKNILRSMECSITDRVEFRYEAVLMRQRFDQNKDISNIKQAKELLAQGEKEYFIKRHYQLRKFEESPGGVAYEREVIPPDWMLDYWHPLEKAEYPDYFSRREKRKKEFLEYWRKHLVGEGQIRVSCGQKRKEICDEVKSR